LAIVATGYCGVGPRIYRKVDGLLPWSTVWALGPGLFGQHLSRMYYRRQCRAWDEVTPHVWIGSALREREACAAVAAGVTAVLDVTAEFSAPRAFRALTYRNIQVLDLTAPTFEQLQAMSALIHAQSARGIVYVHCKIGYSRSAAAVGAYLLSSGGAKDVDEVLASLRSARPSIVVRPEIRTALADFQARMPDLVLASRDASPL
ncbi:MAG: dual specificity protein phosphatase family protein, partial [Chthoniobacterales bacterium]